ncbi:uncharacterized protein LOC117108605 [Anneissia japonica]|uniref:uncharacterized protein LOC117108605 n=1 Tax=Anneissia japonica TaxID=1529436 RepID=UPI00142554AF|nr:uncharacterized protein LOC117108605 [Anneissia japonica]XP_033106574.1 uncharacterized protein LOC117108605 [Anneissia japonica]
MQEQDVLSKAAARPVQTWINLWKPEISELILDLVKACGNEDEVKQVRAWLYDPSTIPTTGFTIAVTILMMGDYLISDDISTIRMCFGKFMNQIPLLPVIKMLIIKEVDVTEKEKIAERYIREVLEDAKYKDNLQLAYDKWEETKADQVKVLRDIADEMVKSRQRGHIASLVGSSVSALGAGVAVGVTVAAAIIPGGLLLEGAIVAGASAVGIAGGAASIGASVATSNLARRAEKKSENVLKAQAKTTEDLIKLFKEYKEKTKIHMETVKRFDDVVVRFEKLHEDRVRVSIGIGDSAEEVLGYVKSFIQGIKWIKGKKTNIVKIVMLGGGKEIARVIGAAVPKAALNVADDALGCAGQVLRKGARVFGVVAGVAVIGFEVYNIVNTAMEVHKGSPDKAAEAIREAANELEMRTLPELKDLIIQTKLEAAEESGIQEITE